MEERQYKNQYLPFAKAKFVSPSDISENILSDAGNYEKYDIGQKTFLSVFSEFIKTSEEVIGRRFFSACGGKIDSLPLNWIPIINYLKEKKLIRSFSFGNVYYDEPKIIRSFIISNHENLADLTDGLMPRSDAYANGESLNDVEEAVAKTIGEFLERFPFLFYREKDLLKCSCDDLEIKKKKYLNPDIMAGFSEKQKEKHNNLRFNKQSDFLWAKGKSLFDGSDYFIPAQLVFWAYNTFHNGWKESFIREQNTNGAGGHYTPEKAILSGLYELIQRDGLLIYWLNKKSPPRIKLETIEYEPTKNLLEECRQLNFEINFYNTTTDLSIPSCICSVFDHTGIGPRITLGGGCDLDWNKTIFRALSEALCIYHWSRERKENIGMKFIDINCDYRPFEDSNMNQIERINLWTQDNMFEHFRFFSEGQKISFNDLKNNHLNFFDGKEELNYLIEKFKTFGKDYEIFYYQAKNKFLDELGYCSVKVIVPALVPIYLREIAAPLGSKRLKEVPEKLGFKPAENWNPLPHPFP